MTGYHQWLVLQNKKDKLEKLLKNLNNAKGIVSAKWDDRGSRLVIDYIGMAHFSELKQRINCIIMESGVKVENILFRCE